MVEGYMIHKCDSSSSSITIQWTHQSEKEAREIEQATQSRPRSALQYLSTSLLRGSLHSKCIPSILCICVLLEAMVGIEAMLVPDMFVWSTGCLQNCACTINKKFWYGSIMIVGEDSTGMQKVSG